MIVAMLIAELGLSAFLSCCQMVVMLLSLTVQVQDLKE